MTLTSTVWRLPSATAFVDDVEMLLEQGLLLVPGDRAMPSDLDGAVRERLQRRSWVVEHLHPKPADLPASTIAGVLGGIPTLEGLLSNALTDHVVIVDLGSPGAACDEWKVFLQRFHQARVQQGSGLGLLLTEVPSAWSSGTPLPVLSWGDRLRRLDVTIWADIHSPADRADPLATLASALAVELCAWRLDLAAAIAGAPKEDLLNPAGWLRRRDERPVTGGRHFGSRKVECPLALLAEGRTPELDQRIWRAQLAAFFPWLEELRLDLVRKHRSKLRLDEHLRKLGARDAEDIELGPMFFQLRGRLAGNEGRLLQALVHIRNDLAHGRPATPHDLDEAIRFGLSGA